MKKEKFQIAYKKLKSSVYFDKSAAILKRQIAEFECNDFEKKIDLLCKALKNKDDNKWQQYLQKKLEMLSVCEYPKQIDSAELNYKSIIINKENEDNEISICNSENIQFRIVLPVELHILGVLWVNEIGVKLDKKFTDVSYGNRLLNNDDESKINKEWSPYLYKPYFEEYESWRDKGLEVAEKLYKDKKDCLIIMLDIKRFFYSVNFTERIFDTFIDTDNMEIKRLNNFVYQVIEEYSNKIHETLKDDKRNKFLPIGFLPSSILSNWYLDEFDKNIINRINPSYYGRYVDDMIIVDKVEKNSVLNELLTDKDISVEKVLENYFIDAKKQNLIKDYKINENKNKIRENTCTYIINFTDDLHEDAELEIKEQKIKIFYLKSGGTKAIIDKFKDAIKNNSSEFRLLPDGDSIFLDDYNKIYKLEQSESINKLRGIDGIKIDKYELSKFIGKNLTIANLIEDDLESKFYDDLEKIFQPKVIIENYLLWESILNLCIVNRKIDKFKLMVDRILNAIEKIKEKNITNPEKTYLNIKDTLINYLFSSVIRSSTLVWGTEIKRILDKISEKMNKNNVIIGDVNTDLLREQFSKSRMILKTNMSVLLDMFLDNKDNINLELSNEKLYLNDLDLVLKYIKDFIMEKCELPFITSVVKNRGYKYRPYLVTMQDINKILFLVQAINGKVLSEDSYKGKNIKSTSEMIEKLYNSINFNEKFSQKEKTNLINVAKYICDRSNVKRFQAKIQENYNIININGRESKKSIKVAIAIARDKDKYFNGVLMDEPNRTLERYSELSEIIRQTVESKSDILILPENYIPFEWLGLLEREAKKNKLAIITGVEHIKVNGNVFNLIASLFPYEYDVYKFVYTNLRTKVFYSPEEKRQIEGYGYNYIEGNEYNLFIWNNIWIPVYCCFEIASIVDRGVFFSLADFLVIVEWNKDTSYFSNIIDSLCRDMHCFCAQVNTADYGDSCLVQPAKSYKQTLLRTKGGINSGVLVGKIDIDNLRRFQVKDYELQKDDKSSFKTTPPNFNKDIIRAKIKNKLFEEIKNIDK